MTADTIELVIQVKDTGIGIAPEMQEKIFEEFTQAENELSRKYEGTGLGLTITKKLSALLGGNVAVSSAVGVRISIHSDTSFCACNRSRRRSPGNFYTDASLKNKSVLIVDDEEMNILLAQTILTNWGNKDGCSSQW
jgi:CheY-like chemotaxis protein